MRNVAIITVVLIAGLAGLNSCSSDKAPAPIIDNGGLIDSSKATYSLRTKAIFDANCNISSCHNATTGQSGLILDTYDRCKDAVANRTVICRIEGTACGARMPFGRDPLPDSAIAYIKSWKANNYPN